MNKRDDQLRQIKEEIINCQKCSLHKARILPVIGQGSHQSKIMLVGEAPGASEAKTGRPFCGQAGQVLDELLEGAGIKREEIYITNILKDRPPNNRDPQKDEIKACTPYLERQIKIINPRIIGALGNYSTVYLLEKFDLADKIQGISKIHGQVFETAVDFGPIKIIPLYHPAVVVYNQKMKEILMKDFIILKDILQKINESKPI